MKRLKVVALGVVAVLGLLVVPSFASSPELVEDPVYSLASDTAYSVLSSVSPYASSTPSYPSGTAYSYITGDSPLSSPTSSTSDFYTAVATGLTQGFKIISKGLYRLIALDSGSSYVHFTAAGTGLSSNSNSTYNNYGILASLNENIFYGFQTLFKGLGTMDGHITTMDGHLTSGFTTLGSKLDSNHTSVLTSLSNISARLFDRSVSILTFDSGPGFISTGSENADIGMIGSIDHHLRSITLLGFARRVPLVFADDDGVITKVVVCYCFFAACFLLCGHLLMDGIFPEQMSLQQRLVLLFCLYGSSFVGLCVYLVCNLP